jgi:uncharacterized membrane protein
MKSVFAMMVALFALAGPAAAGDGAGTTQLAQSAIVPERAVRTAPEAAPEVGLKVCNKSDLDAQFAVGYHANEHDSSGQNLYRSTGWFRVNAGTCNTIIKSALRYRYYFVHAFAVNSTVSWTPEEGIYLCVSREPFEFKETRCPEGMNRRLFRILDTGDSVSWTYNLQ